MENNYELYDVPKICDFKELLNYCVNKYKEKTAFSFFTGNTLIEISYKKLYRDVEALGTYFLKTGMNNHKIAIIGENSYQWILTFLASFQSMTVVVPVNRELSLSEILIQMIDCNPSYLIYSEGYEELAEEIHKEYPEIELICTTTFPELIEIGNSELAVGNSELSKINVNNTKLNIIIYTSGTSGVAKGVMLSQKNLITDLIGMAKNVMVYKKVVLTLPLHHMYAWTVSIFLPMIYGAQVYINSDLKRLSKELKIVKPTWIVTVPAILEFYYKNIISKIKMDKNAEYYLQLIEKIDENVENKERREIFSNFISVLGENIEFIISGGSILDIKFSTFYEKLGIPIINGYGLTECSPVISVNRNEYYRNGSIGLPLECNSVKIKKPDKSGCGEIMVKGDNVMIGYYNKKVDTMKAFDIRWFKTGDIGRLDEDGFLYIMGRIKNLIILSNGENVSAEEIEEFIYSITNVKEVVVYGEKNLIVAEIFPEIVSDQVKIQINDAVNQLNQSLAPYKRIGTVRFRNIEFLKTSTNKIKRLARS